MPRKRKQKMIDEMTQGELFGQRMARFRQAAGYSQRELAAELGISNRVIAYYEAQTKYPPTYLLPQLAETLGVSVEELLGIKPGEEKKLGVDNRLWRRFKQVAKLPAQERKQIAQLIDALLERQKLKQQAA